MMSPTEFQCEVLCLRSHSRWRPRFLRLLRLTLGVCAAGQADAQSLVVTSGPAPLSGYPHTTTSTINLSGVADAVATSSVKVNGIAVIWTPSNGTWNASGILVPPGVNRVLIQALDATGKEIERLGYDVWYDDGSVQSVSGSITANTMWTANGGPYDVTASISISSGATLTIEPGTSVYLGSGVNFTIASGGTLSALGTDTQPIRFTRAPGTSANWGGMTVNGIANISYAHFEFNGATVIHSQWRHVTPRSPYLWQRWGAVSFARLFLVRREPLHFPHVDRRL